MGLVGELRMDVEWGIYTSTSILQKYITYVLPLGGRSPNPSPSYAISKTQRTSSVVVMGRSFSLLSVAAAVLSASVSFAASTGRPKCLQSELAAMLSPEAELFVPSDPDYGNASIRWSTFDEPTFRAYVEVATEQDIQETVS